MLIPVTPRERRSGFAGTFVALCLGSAITSMSALAYASAGPQVPERLAGAPVLVRAPAAVRADGNFTPDRPWSPETVTSLAGRLAAVPGVAAAVPDHVFYAQPVVGGRPGGDGRGHAWSAAALAPYPLTSGRAPERDGEVVLDRALGAGPGTRVTLLTSAGPVPYTVTGTVDEAGPYLSDAAAARLAGGVRTIGLVTEPGADPAMVERAAREVTGDRGEVLSGEARAALEPLDDARIRWIGAQVLTAMVVLAGFVSVFVVASTFAFDVARRRRELGLLRAVGATPRQIRRMMYGEALAVGAVAALTGVALGVALAPVLGDLLVGVGFQPATFTVRIQAWPPVAAFAGGLVVALLGVWSASRRAAGVRPLEALRDAEVDERPMPRGRWIAGLVCTLGGLAAAVAGLTTSAAEMVPYVIYTAMALIVGLTLLAPALVPPVIRAATWPLTRLRGATGMLVRESSLAAVRRTASTAAPVLATVGFAVLVTGMVQTTAAAYGAGRTATVRAGAVVLPSGTPGLSDAVGGASALPTAVYGENVTVPAAGVTPEVLARSGTPKMISGSLGGLRGETMVVEEWLAEKTGWRPGDVADVTFEDGRTVALRVVGVMAEAPFGMLLPRELVRAHDPSALADEAYLPSLPGRPGLPSLPERPGLPGPVPMAGELGARVVDLATYAVEADAEEDRLVWIFTLLLVAVSAGYTAVAIANTLMMATASRARDLAVLRLAGATNRQVLGVMAAESALVVAIGTVLGTTVAIPALLRMRAGLSTSIGAPVPLVVPWPVVLAVVAACLLLATVTSMLATRTRNA
ncbi:FtsX-like permease family protein [Streptosporangium sp. NPDC002524]|uniref:FtsX-like permease family protein n=1 Tax=Streptosporangium sp. NPDC002524 TaxID=3154537 RepID=UPI003320208F